MLRLMATCLALVALYGCAAQSPAPVGDAVEVPAAQAEAPSTASPAPAAPPAAPPDPAVVVAVGAAADGATCLQASECASGVCEGLGCEADSPGQCMPASRACTRDLRAFCTCEGTTIRTSGSCPAVRYSSAGECPGEPLGGGMAAPKVIDGGACLSGDECQSGVCEGLGCGPDAPGSCVSTDRMCTADYMPSCGCDGVTFHGSSSCPGKRYAKKGPCDAP